MENKKLKTPLSQEERETVEDILESISDTLYQMKIKLKELKISLEFKKINHSSMAKLVPVIGSFQMLQDAMRETTETFFENLSDNQQ